MKDIKIFPLAIAFAGCFLGAGFVSGQEIWQFFGSFGVPGYIGLVLACALLVLIGIVLVRVLQMTGSDDSEQVMFPWENRILRRLTGFIVNGFLFGVVIIMTAGVGATLQQIFSIPSALSSAVFVALIGIIALTGVQGMMKSFSALVPLIVASTVAFAVFSWFHFGTEGILSIQPQAETNPLMPNWFISSLTYVAYNLLGAVGIMTPLGKYIPNAKTARLGVSLGGVMLLAVAGCVLTALTGYLPATETQTPMVALASHVSGILGILYGLLLFLGMFNNALASLVAFMEYINPRVAVMHRHRKLSMLLLMAAVWVVSLAGFGNLVGTVFPVFGYIGILLIVCLVIHYFKCRRAQRLNSL